MISGISDEDKKVRYDMLSYHMAALIGTMTKSGYKEPVGLLIDTSDNYGREIAKACMERQGVDYQQHLDICIAGNLIPTLLMVLPLGVAKELLQFTAPNAAKNLSTPRPANTQWAVCMARGGNTYATVALPSKA